MSLQRIFPSCVAVLCLAAALHGHAMAADDTVDAAARAEIAALEKRIEALERLLGRTTQALPVETDPFAADEFASIEDATSRTAPAQGITANPWYRNAELKGFAAVSFIDSGNAGTRPDGGFLIKEASLFLEADIWEDTSFYLELQTNRLGDDKTKWVRTGEAYVHFRDVPRPSANASMGVKVGRIDIPFGEEYLVQDASDMPFINHSVVYPYGWDEGVLLYGQLGGLGWAAAITDGTDQRSIEDHPAKAFNGKIWGNPVERLYLSASFMANGDAAKSAMEFAGSHFQPVGASHGSTVGTSPNDKVDGQLFQVDAKWRFGEYLDAGYLALTFGEAYIDDNAPGFDRDFSWYVIEPYVSLSNNWYLAARISAIGTGSSTKGYHFDGKTTAGGHALGYDVESLRRYQLALGWIINSRVSLKFEYAKDRFKLIDASPLDPNNGDRDLIGVELTAKF